MKKVVLSVFDKKAALFSNPFYSVNADVGIRDFTNACLDSSVSLSRNPRDYDLYHVADFEDESGLFVPVNPPKFVASASAVLVPYQDIPFETQE